MRVAIFGLGAVGRKIPGLLSPDVDLTIVSRDPQRRAVAGLSANAANRATWAAAGSVPDCDIGVIALPVGEHRAIAQRLLQRGADVVSLSDSVADVAALQRLDVDAANRGRRIVPGAGFSPGLSCVLARHAASSFERIDEVHVAKQGTGGPSCARQHHAALKRSAWDFRDGTWRHRPGGSGRELQWFPAPVGGADCYRAELADALLLQPAFPDAQRISARVAATRRDRFTSRLPMLTPPHAEGGLGALRVEVWGHIANQSYARVFGVAAHPAFGAAVTAAVTVGQLVELRNLDAETPVPETPVPEPSWAGTRGLAEWVDPMSFLRTTMAMGLSIETFEGHREWVS